MIPRLTRNVRLTAICLGAMTCLCALASCNDKKPVGTIVGYVQTDGKCYGLILADTVQLVPVDCNSPDYQKFVHEH